MALLHVRAVASLASSRASTRVVLPAARQGFRPSTRAATTVVAPKKVDQAGAQKVLKADKKDTDSVPFLKRIHEEYASIRPNCYRIHAETEKTFQENQAWQHPILVESADGARFTDVDGNHYIDMLNGFGSNLLGHNNDEFNQSMEELLESGAYFVGGRSPILKEASDLVCNATGMDKCYFFESGTMACHTALRLARTYRKKDKIMLFNSSWHGQSDSTLFISDDEGTVFPFSGGQPENLTENIAMFNFGDFEAIECLREMGDEIACVMLEPVPLKKLVAASKEFLEALREVCTEKGVVLIFDEVVTGFRVALGGCQELFGVKADLATYGKAMGGNCAVGVVAGKEEIMNCMPNIAVGGTYCSNPMQLMTVAKTVGYLTENKDTFYPTLEANTGIMTTRVTEAAKTMNIPLICRQFQSIIRLEFEPWFQSKSVHIILAFILSLRSKGLYYQTFGPYGFTTRAHTKEVMEEVTQIVVDTLTEFHSVGMFPKTRPA